MAPLRKISELQAFEIETADDSGIRPKAAHELASHQVGGPKANDRGIGFRTSWKYVEVFS